MAANLNKINKRQDVYALHSATNLKKILEGKIKKVYIKALGCIEIRFGKSFDGFEEIRRQILRTGNDAVREINELIDKSFNVEEVPNVITVNFTNNGKEGSNEGTEEV